MYFVIVNLFSERGETVVCGSTQVAVILMCHCVCRLNFVNVDVLRM